MSLTNKFEGNLNVVGSNIRKIRKEKGFSYEYLATKLELMGISIHRQSIYDIEKNKRAVKDYELYGLAKALDVDVNVLLEDIKKRLKEF